MTGCRSFRGSRERDFISFDKESAEISLSFCNSEREQNITLRICRNAKEKKIMLNRIPCSGGKKLFEQFKCIAFLPSDTELADGIPEKRRKFMDLCCSQLKPSFMEYIRRYELILSHRSAVLKAIAAGTEKKENLLMWNKQLADTGAVISLMRHRYSIKLAGSCFRLYSGITDGSEQLTAEYHSNIYPSDYAYPESVDDEMLYIYRQRLENSTDDDVRLGYTQYGIHRDDLNLKINGLPVKIYGSQGQKKSSALALRLAQAEILKNESHESPVILLDDVMSELDDSRQKLVSSVTEGMQVFVTTCSADALNIKAVSGIYHMENGVLTSI